MMFANEVIFQMLIDDRVDVDNLLQLKFLATNATLFIFTWDRVAERRISPKFFVSNTMVSLVTKYMEE